MAREAVDEFGQRWVENDDGEWIVTPEHGVMEFAGKQFHDMADNLALWFSDDEGRRNQLRDQLAERERMFSGAEAVSPIASLVGEALPTAAIGPIGRMGWMAGAATNAAIGGIEGALSYDDESSVGQRAAAGAVGGAVGDMAGRIVGRVWNAGRGLADDMWSGRRALSGALDDPDLAAIAEFESLGGRTAAFQRMTPGSKAQRMAEQAAKMNEASINPDPYLKEIMDNNDALYRNAAAEAVGNPLEPGQRLDAGWLRDTIDKHSSMFKELANLASERGELRVHGALKQKLQNNRVIRELQRDFGRFKGLERKQAFLTGSEFMEARQALAAEAALEENSALAFRKWKLVEELDDMITRAPRFRDFADAYAGVREANRNLMLLERPNVIDNRGEINVKTLKNVLNSKTSGYGRKASAMGDLPGQKPHNPATERLIKLARVGDRAGFTPFKSSGTAENLIGNLQMAQAANAGVEALAGNPLPAMSMAIQGNAPRFIGAANRGNGALFEGLYTAAPQGVLGTGQVVGRSMLDEAFYPFVGADDERQP